AIPRNIETSEKLRQLGEIQGHHEHATKLAVDFNRRGHHRGWLKPAREEVDHRPVLAWRGNSRTIPGRALRLILACCLEPLLEEDVAWNRLVDIAPECPSASPVERADLDHFDCVVQRRVGTEEASIRKTEADPGEGWIRAQHRQKDELPLRFVV